MVTGHGRYIDDLKKGGMVHAAFVRSTVARGRILEVDASEARKMPGVIMVLTAAETNSPEHQLAGLPPDNTPRAVLADQYVRYVGDPIAIVVAESRYLAEDAAELVSVEIEPLDPVVTAAQGLADNAPLVHPELPNNLAGVLPGKEMPELDELLENAPHVFHETFDQHRYVNVPMETRGLVVEWDTSTKQIERGLRLPGRARAPGLPGPDAGHSRGRDPRHHGRCRRLLRPEDLHRQGRAGRGDGGHGHR